MILPRILLGLTTLVALWGCRGFVRAASEKERDVPQLVFVDHDAFKPHGLPYERAGLTLAGTMVPVEVKRREEPGAVVFDLVAHGQIVEDERYAVTENGFALIEAAGERYEPPVPLVRYPMKSGVTWAWSGTMHCGARKRPAQGRLSVERDSLNVRGGPYDTLRVDFRLRIDGGFGASADRKLAFWFASGKGIVKREFGFCSTREPLPEAR